jgi:hypothetical protein
MKLWIIFGIMTLSIIILPRENATGEMCCHDIQKFYKKKYELESKKTLDSFFASHRPIME